MSSRMFLGDVDPEAGIEDTEVTEDYGGNSINDPNPSGNPNED